MIDSELSDITKNVDDFILANKEKIEVLINLQNQLINIDDSSFPNIIDYITKHKNIFFNDHPSTIFFFEYLISFSRHSFKQMELLLDIIIHFSKDIKNEQTQVTECELLSICINIYVISINYLYLKNFFSIDSIVKKSFNHFYVFYNFLPEIEEYDHEFAELGIKNTKNNIDNELLQNFKNLIQSDYSKHILNRNLCYNPSSLHKSIREDNIDLFQEIVSKNNIKLNDTIQFSFYERTKTMDKNLSPIKVAALYGSIKIFKFLLMNNVIMDDTLLNYAYYGYNSEIIHLIENKCPLDSCYLQPFFNHHIELIEYFIENFGNEIVEDNIDAKVQLKNFSDDNNQYNVLNYKAISCAVSYGNYQIIVACLKKIAFLAKNVDLVKMTEDEADQKQYILSDCVFNIDLIKFYINQIKKTENIMECGVLFSCIKKFIKYNSNDGFKFLFSILKDDLNIYNIFNLCVEFNCELANFLLDMSIEGREKKNENDKIYQKLKKKVDYSTLDAAFVNYDEDIIVKLIQLFDPIKTIDDLTSFVKSLDKYLCSKMILSLFERLCKILRRDKLLYIAIALEDAERYSVSEYIKKNLPKKTD